MSRPWTLGWEMKLLFPRPERAARTCLLVATDPALETATGGYWRSGRRRERPRKHPDRELGARLWRESVRLTGVDLPA